MCAVYIKEAKWVRMEKCGGKWGMPRGACHFNLPCHPLSTQIFSDFSDPPTFPQRSTEDH